MQQETIRRLEEAVREDGAQVSSLRGKLTEAERENSRYVSNLDKNLSKLLLS